MNGRKPSVALFSLGCKLNQAEIESITDQFGKAGYALVDPESGSADVFILNTCSVTHIADRKSRHMIRMWRNRNPDALIVATGCYVQRAPSDLTEAGADIVIDNSRKSDLFNMVRNAIGHISTGITPLPVDPAGNRVRSFIKIQDGCRHFCSYCIVPLVRNPEYSVPAAVVLEEIRERSSRGYREIVLTGTRIGTYSSDNLDLSGLVHRILKETDIRRLHLSSLQPDEISDRLLNLWPENRLCCHFHLALQSGSGSVLKRMNRGYTLDDYKKAVDSIRNVLPDASITTDIVVGFPGETEIEFEESYRYCSSMEFAAIHVFPYSARPGTAAAEMVGHMTAQVKKARSLKMLALSRRCSREYRGKFLGKELTVLWEGEDEPGSGIYSGLTENYIRLFRHSSEHLSGIFQSVKPVQLDRNGLWA